MIHAYRDPNTAWTARNLHASAFTLADYPSPKPHLYSTVPQELLGLYSSHVPMPSQLNIKKWGGLGDEATFIAS